MRKKSELPTCFNFVSMFFMPFAGGGSNGGAGIGRGGGNGGWSGGGNGGCSWWVSLLVFLEIH